MLKHVSGWSQPHIRFIYLSDACDSVLWTDDIVKRKDVKEIRLKEVTAVRVGKDSNCFNGKFTDQAILSCCFSLVTPSRALDLQANDVETCAFWVTVLNKLVYHVQHNLGPIKNIGFYSLTPLAEWRDPGTANSSIKKRSSRSEEVREDSALLSEKIAMIGTGLGMLPSIDPIGLLSGN